jgi:hypothetical protein
MVTDSTRKYLHMSNSMAEQERTRRWLLQHFEPAVLEQLVRGQPGSGSSIRQIMAGLHPQDHRLLQWLCHGTGPSQPAHLQQVIEQVARQPHRLPLVWLVANPIGRSLLAGGSWHGGQTAQLDDETVKLLKRDPALYAVKYSDGGQPYSGVKEAQLFDARSGQTTSPPYRVGATVWVKFKGERSKAAITHVTPQWVVRLGSGEKQTVKEGRLKSSQMHPMWAADHPAEGYAPWAQGIHTRWGTAAQRKQRGKPLQGVWKEASAVAQRTARLAVLDTARRALGNLQRAAKRGAEQGAAEANLAAVQTRVQQGAHAGTFTAEQREQLLAQIREGVQNGVGGQTAATPEYAYEEEALLPMTVQGLPPETVRFSGNRCMSRCTDPAACHAQRCTRNGAKPLTSVQGTPLLATKDAGLLHDVVPLLCPDWVEAAKVEAQERILLCPQCHNFLMAGLQLRSPNTLLVVR